MDDSFLTIMKNTSYGLVFINSVAYFGVTPISVLMLSILILTDIFFGILKSASLHGWRSIQSNILQRGILAKVLVIFVPTTLAFTGKGIGIQLGMLAQSVINVLILSELYSIIGNIYAIRTGHEKVEFDAVAYVLSGMKNVLKSVIIEDAPGPEEK